MSSNRSRSSVGRAAVAQAILAALLVANAAAGELTVGPSLDVTPRLAEGDQRWPAVAAGGGIYLVVWQEGEAMAGAKDTSILGVRVSADGKPLEAKPLPICTAKGFQIYPAVTFDGTDFLVAWQDYRSARDWDVYAARVSTDGRVVDRDGFVIADGPGNQIYPAACSDNGGCLMVWSDLRPQQDAPEAYALRTTRVAGGRPERPGGRVLVPHYDPDSKRVRSYLTPTVVYDGEDFVVAAQYGPSGWEYGAPLLMRIGRDGTSRVIPGGFLAPTFALAADPASATTFVFSNQRTEHGSYQPRYLSSIFTRSDEQQNHVLLGLQDKFPPRNDMWCAATFDGRSFVAVVEQFPEYNGRVEAHRPIAVQLVATRVDPATARPLDAGAEAAPAEAWKDIRPYGKGRDRRPEPRRGIAVTNEPDAQHRHPAMASLGGGRSLVVYSRHAGPGRCKVHAVLLSQERRVPR